MRMRLLKRCAAMKLVVPALYVAGAIGLRLEFVRTNPDGLANVWLVVYTSPVFVGARFRLFRARQRSARP
jgi:hypothetical protein